jgi:hypothetical protein
MARVTQHKRQNFNVTPEEEAELNRLQEVFGASSVKDAILRSARLALTLASEVREGKKVYLADSQGRETRVLLPDLERGQSGWKYLAPRAEGSRRQLFLKGRRLSAANVWLDMLTNDRTKAETAENWDLPIDAIEEIILYCESNRPLIDMEAQEAARILREHGNHLASVGSK